MKMEVISYCNNEAINSRNTIVTMKSEMSCRYWFVDVSRGLITFYVQLSCVFVAKTRCIQIASELMLHITHFTYGVHSPVVLGLGLD